MRILSIIVQIPRRVMILLVRFYQLMLSPYVGGACRYQPTCSAYSIEAFERYGAIRGFILTVFRIVRCNPWGGHGYDPPRWFGEDPEDVDGDAGDLGGASDPVTPHSVSHS